MNEPTLDSIYQWIEEYMYERGYAPTVREIGAGCDISSTATVFKYLNRLQDQGELSWVKGKSRTISLTSKISHGLL